MDGPRFAFEVHIEALTERIPGPADLRNLVSTHPKVSIAGAPAPSTGDPSTFGYQIHTDWPGMVPVQILVVRQTRTRSVHGSIQEQGGHWQWTGGGQRIPLAADDPCVTRVWPGGREMSDHEFTIFCRTRIISAPVAPGILGAINFSYDLAAERVTGDVNGPAGRRFTLQKDLGPSGGFELDFTVRALDTRGFASDVRPLFRDKDIQSMRFAFDLSSYDDVKTNARDIYSAVSVVSSSFVMPCDGRWPPGPILVFKQWMDQGQLP